MKNKKHLEFYIKCLETGNLPSFGLCGSADQGLIDATLLDQLSPTATDDVELYDSGLSTSYWGSGLAWLDEDKYQKFTTLRQTIVLFMAAINKEL